MKNKLEELSQRTVAELHRDLEAYLNADVFIWFLLVPVREKLLRLQKELNI